MFDILLLLTIGAGAGVAVISLVGLVPISWWPIELFSHFRLQYAAILGVVSIAAALGGETYPAVLLGAAGLINLWQVAPFLELGRGERGPGSHKLVLINVRMRNRAFRHVQRLIEQETPDLLGLVEVDDGWLRALQPVLEERGYSSVAIPRRDSYGLAMFSRFRIISRSPAELGGLPGSSLICTVSIDSQRLNILLVHIPPPLTPRLLRMRDRALTDIGDWLQSSVGEWIVMGDFNVTPWTRRLRGVAKRAGLQSFREQQGIRATWPDQFAPVRIPIDHVFGTERVSFGNSKVGPSVRSDHLPLVVHFSLKDP